MVHRKSITFQSYCVGVFWLHAFATNIVWLNMLFGGVVLNHLLVGVV
jgi:hypothetical protein